MDLGTFVRQILDDTHLLVDESAIKRKVIDSLNFHRAKHYFWGEGNLSFPLIVGQRDYTSADPSFPDDLGEIVGDTLYLKEAGSTTRQEIHRVDSVTLEFWRRSPDTRQTPVYWDFWGNTLRFDTKASATDTVTGRYVKDIEVPKVHWDGSAYDFFLPDGVTALTDAFTNSWLQDDKGAQALRADVMYRLYSSTLKDSDAAQTEKLLWLELVGELETATEQRSGGPETVYPQL